MHLTKCKKKNLGRPKKINIRVKKNGIELLLFLSDSLRRIVLLGYIATLLNTVFGNPPLFLAHSLLWKLATFSIAKRK